MNKKGMTVDNMYPAVLAIILIGIVLGIGIFIMSSVHRQISSDVPGVENAINTTTNPTTLSDASSTNFYLNTATLAAEYANGTTVTNFTSTTAGVVTWGADVAGHIPLLNTTYTYNYDRANSPEVAMQTTITGVATFADWIAIIVVVIAAAIVLGVVLSSFGRRPGI